MKDYRGIGYLYLQLDNVSKYLWGSDVVICVRQWSVGTDCLLFNTTPLGWRLLLLYLILKIDNQSKYHQLNFDSEGDYHTGCPQSLSTTVLFRIMITRTIILHLQWMLPVLEKDLSMWTLVTFLWYAHNYPCHIVTFWWFFLLFMPSVEWQMYFLCN